MDRRGLGNIATDESLLAAVAPQLTVDTTLGVHEMLDMLETFHSVSISDVPEYTTPIVVDTQLYMYKGYPYGDVVFPTQPQDLQTVDAFMGENPPGLSLRPGSITVSVVDGTGSATATAAVVAKLHALGYHVVDTGSQTPVGPISETTVEYSVRSAPPAGGEGALRPVGNRRHGTRHDPRRGRRHHRDGFGPGGRQRFSGFVASGRVRLDDDLDRTEVHVEDEVHGFHHHDHGRDDAELRWWGARRPDVGDERDPLLRPEGLPDNEVEVTKDIRGHRARRQRVPAVAGRSRSRPSA